VHDLHAGFAGSGQQPFDVGQGFVRQHRQPGVGADDRALTLLRDNGGVHRCREIGEFHSHTDAGTS
jgi:hypothetical protein